MDIDINETIRELEEEMLEAANNLEFEKAALLRDQIRELKRSTESASGAGEPAAVGASPIRYGKGRKPGGSRKNPRAREIPEPL